MWIFRTSLTRTAILMAAMLCAAVASEAPRTISLKDYCNLGLTNSPIGTGPLNGPNNLAGLPAGTASYASVPFEVTGLIQLTGHQAVLAGRTFPEKVTGIKVGAPCQRIHLLHGAGWNEVDNTVIATLVVHFADGSKTDIPIVYGKHVYDWWENAEQPSDKDTKVAWTGVNKVSKLFGTDLRIYRTTFANPKPGAVIDHIDYVSTKKESAPFLLGLTVD